MLGASEYFCGDCLWQTKTTTIVVVFVCQKTTKTTINKNNDNCRCFCLPESTYIPFLRFCSSKLAVQFPLLVTNDAVAWHSVRNVSCGWRDLMGRFMGWPHVSRTFPNLRLSGNLNFRVSANVPSRGPLPVEAGLLLSRQEIAY
jgi:hypothetical protein